MRFIGVITITTRQSIAALEEEVSTLRAALVNAEAALENAIRERADEISLKSTSVTSLSAMMMVTILCAMICR